jgi:hypothetical protein
MQPRLFPSGKEWERAFDAACRSRSLRPRRHRRQHVGGRPRDGPVAGRHLQAHQAAGGAARHAPPPAHDPAIVPHRGGAGLLRARRRHPRFHRRGRELRHPPFQPRARHAACLGAHLLRPPPHRAAPAHVPRHQSGPGRPSRTLRQLRRHRRRGLRRRHPHRRAGRFEPSSRSRLAAEPPRCWCATPSATSPTRGRTGRASQDLAGASRCIAHNADHLAAGGPGRALQVVRLRRPPCAPIPAEVVREAVLAGHRHRPALHLGRRAGTAATAASSVVLPQWRASRKRRHPCRLSHPPVPRRRRSASSSTTSQACTGRPRPGTRGWASSSNRRSLTRSLHFRFIPNHL